jgi:hypothetical protein
MGVEEFLTLRRELYPHDVDLELRLGLGDARESILIRRWRELAQALFMRRRHPIRYLMRRCPAHEPEGVADCDLGMMWQEAKTTHGTDER